MRWNCVGAGAFAALSPRQAGDPNRGPFVLGAFHGIRKPVGHILQHGAGGRATGTAHCGSGPGGSHGPLRESARDRRAPHRLSTPFCSSRRSFRAGCGPAADAGCKDCAPASWCAWSNCRAMPLRGRGPDGRRLQLQLGRGGNWRVASDRPPPQMGTLMQAAPSCTPSSTSDDIPEETRPSDSTSSAVSRSWG